MILNIDEARTLDLLARHGSIAKTAQTLHKSGAAVVYTLASIETKVGMPVFDRTTYRTKLLPVGERLRAACQKLLEASNELDGFCASLQQGYESDLQIIVEGIVPLDPLLAPLRHFLDHKIPTRVHVNTKFLGEVESVFRERKADFMVSLLAPEDSALESIALPEIPAVLVAHRDHPLCAARKTWTSADLKKFPILTVKGSDPKLATATAKLERDSIVQVNDFHSKKSAILHGLGYGWLPEYLIGAELRSKRLKTIRWSHSSKHVFRPRIYHRGARGLGRSGKIFLELLAK